MQFHTLKPNTLNRKRMQVGRGGKRGKTSGRGTKGMNARAGHKKRSEMRDIIKRIPKLRGYAFNSIEQKAEPVSLTKLEKAFKAKDIVSPQSLARKGVVSMVSGKFVTIKILADGEITKALTIVDCRVSATAKAKIEKAGGTVKVSGVAVVAKVATKA
jgi:large subunit ribosomal protein L15